MSDGTDDSPPTEDVSDNDAPGQVIRHILPLGMRVLVKLLDAQDRTASGLYLPQGVVEKHQDALYGEVVEVARTAADEESLGENVSGVPAGARVLMAKDAGVAVPWDSTLRIVETKQILATVEEVPMESVN